MDIFDLRSSGGPYHNGFLPQRYESGWARIGELDEPLFFSTEIWSANDYRRHWQDAAERIANGSCIELFCCDLSRYGTTAFVGIKTRELVMFTQYIFKFSMLEVDDTRITLKDPSILQEWGESEPSRWQVSINAVRAYANR